MELDGVTKLLEAVTKMLAVIIWPAAVLYILARFASQIGEFVSTWEMTFRGAGFEATAKRRHSEAGAALVAATVSKPEEMQPR